MLQEIDTNKYAFCLYEINQRIKIIADYLNFKYREGVYVDEYKITIIEFLCLQFRKIIEYITFLSVIANHKDLRRLNSRYARQPDIRKIFIDLEKANPGFFPVPISKEVINANKSEFKWNILEEKYLTKEKSIEIFEICGQKLHAINPFNPDLAFLEIFEDFHDWLTDIHTLLSHHIVTLADNTTIVMGILETKETGYPQAVIFKEVSTGE